MSDPSIEVFKVNDGAIKVRGRVEVTNRVEVRGRVQAHGHMKTSVSGNIVQISGQTVNAIVSGLNVNVSGAIVQISGQTVITSISGQSVNVTGISISGVSVEISGDIVQISGQAVTTSVSGNIVQISGSVVQISGSVVQIATPSEVLTGSSGSNPFIVTTASGGVAISSGVIVSVVLKSPSTNSGDIYVGGRSAYLPFSGFGYILSKGDMLMFDMDNFNKVFVVATVSGDIISFMGID